METDWMHVTPYDVIWLKDYRRTGPMRNQRFTLTCKHTSFVQCQNSKTSSYERDEREYSSLIAYNSEESRCVSDSVPDPFMGQFSPPKMGWGGVKVTSGPMYAIQCEEEKRILERRHSRSPSPGLCKKCSSRQSSEEINGNHGPHGKTRGRPTWRDLVIGEGKKSTVPNRCYRKQWASGNKEIPKSSSMEPLKNSVQESSLTKGSSEDSPSKSKSRQPRAISLERATTDTLRRRKVGSRDNHYTPPRRYLNVWKENGQDHMHRSNQNTSDRPPCGPGPPLKQLRAYTVEATSPTGSSSGRSRQRSISGNAVVKKTPVRRLDEEALKRSRLHSSQYELSQDLLDKQVEMLERKYGGVRALHAALTIQRAFRKHCMMKRFQDIANASKGEKRLSRRFHNLDADGKEWTLFNGSTLHQCQYEIDQESSHISSESVHSSAYIDAVLKSNIAPLYRELSDTYDGDSSPTKCNRPFHEKQFVHHILGDSTRTESFLHTKEISPYVTSSHRHKSLLQDESPTISSSGPDDSTYMTPLRSPPSVPRHPAWTAVPCSSSVRQGHHLGPTVYLSPSQPVGSATEEQFHTPRESLSSEDSAISSTGVEGDSITDDHPQLHRDSTSRHSTTGVITRHPGTGMPHARSADLSQVRKLSGDKRKIPPRVPKRTSSIASHDMKSWSEDESDLISPSPSGISGHDHSSQMLQGKLGASPVWKRKSLVLEEHVHLGDDKRLSNISENSEDSIDGGGGYSTSLPASDMIHSLSGHNYADPSVRNAHDMLTSSSGYKISEIQRKRQYRVGLNLFNKKPDRGIRYLIHRGFLEASPQAVARFLVSRKGLSKQMVGEYLGNLQSPFNMAVLECFVEELDLAGMQVDVALRKFQTFFRMPGEAQKIERLVEVFSHRYIECNRDIVSKFQSADTVFVLAFAIIMLNTDLHTPNMKADKRMKLEDFIKNLRGIDDGHDLDRDMLVGIYERIKSNEFKPGADHVTQVIKVQQTIVGKKQNLALPHRRLVCYCRLYEVYDVNKKERPGVHQREVFLFNDMLMVTKIFSKKKNSVTYNFRLSFPLCGMSVTLFEAPYYPHGIRLSQRVDDKVLVTFNARNEHDRSKFVEDLKESILEMDEMENLRIEGELEKQKMMRARGGENRDSGVADIEILPSGSKDGKLSPEGHSSNLKRSALSNSLLDLHEQPLNKPVRRGSAGSLDSGMSISFQSSTASTVSHDSSPQTVHTSATGGVEGRSAEGASKSSGQQGFLGNLFSKKAKAANKAHIRKPTESTDI